MMSSKLPPPLPSVPIPIDSRVTAHGLKSRPDWNGRSGTVICFYRDGGPSDGRCGIQFDGNGDDLPTVAIKPANLVEEGDYRPWRPTATDEVNEFFDDVYKLRDEGKMACFQHEYTNAVACAAVHGNDAEAAYIFGRTCLDMVMDGDDEEGLNVGYMLLERAARKLGHLPSMKWLGVCIENGISFGQCEAKCHAKEARVAAKLYRDAAERDYAPATLMLAKMYDRGEPLKDNGCGKRAPERAAVLYEKAARLGEEEAAFNLGCSYHVGDGVRQDDALAAYWYRVAAEGGDADGMTNLAVSLEIGQGVKVDMKEANRWYEMAAEKGCVKAQTNLGLNLLKGRGCEVDTEAAVAMLRRAADSGSSHALCLLKQLEVAFLSHLE